MMTSPNDDEPGVPDLAETLDAMVELVASFDSDGRLAFLNAAGRRFLGISADSQLPAWILSDLLPDEEAERFVDEVLPRSIETGQWSGRVLLQPPSGSPVPFRVRLVAHPRGDAPLRGFTLVAAESRPSPGSSAIREDEVDHLLSVFHDLKNLLGPILAHAELAEAALPPSSPVRRRLELILQAADSARELCSQVESSRRTGSRFRVLDVARVAEDVLGLLCAEFPGSSIALAGRIEATEVFGDERELHRALMNVCRNAAEALPAGRGHVRLALEITQNGRRVRLSVSDDGRGMSAEQLSSAFAPYYSTKGAGTGLGLTLAREIVRGHGGSMNVESELGVGTTIRIDLPRHSSATPSS